MSNSFLIVENLCKDFVRGDTVINVLKSVSFSIARGQFACVVGSSGAGKTTLLHVVGTLLRPTSGNVIIDSKEVFQAKKAELSRFRNERIGFVFQFHYLLPEFSAAENVSMPLMIRRVSPREAQLRSLSLLEKVGLEQRSSHRPAELSFGEQQRVAVARALVGDPEIVLADEPTGNLDRETGQRVFSLLLDLTIKQGKTLVVVTHNQELASQADQVLRLTDGVCACEAT